MTNLEIYIQGWLKMRYIIAIFIALGVVTYLVERRDKLGDKDMH